ncbi:MAG: hypothetical protein KDB88_09985 [Flavobacteriales bacterium]|nr:hypothetical protein [Flavobacteriales bacterium]
MKSYNHIVLLVAIIGLLIHLPAHAQKDKKVKTTFEEIEAQCADRPMDQRVRASVTRFNVTANAADPALGSNLSSMLTTALYEVNCFRLLESLDKKEDMTQEIDFAQSGYSDASKTPAKGKMLGAQVVITGEVTEFSRKSQSVGAMGFKSTSITVRMGFVLKLLDPTTRDVLWAKSVNVEGKEGGSSSYGFRVPLAGRINFGDGGSQDPATANALENGVFEACALLVDNIDSVELPEAADPDMTTSRIQARGVDFMGLKELEGLVSTAPAVKEVNKELKDGTGILTVQHKGSTEDLLDAIHGGLKGRFTVTGFDAGSIELAPAQH